MNVEYFDRLRARLHSGFATVGDSVISDVPGFAWNASFLDRSIQFKFSAILAFVPAGSLDEVLVFEASVTNTHPAKWTMDLVGSSLTAEDLRCQSEDWRSAITSDPDLAADAVFDFLARVRPLMIQELADWARRNRQSQRV
jgi:hypothetical protein